MGLGGADDPAGTTWLAARGTTLLLELAIEAGLLNGTSLVTRHGCIWRS
jgi:hypothetical protein